MKKIFYFVVTLMLFSACSESFLNEEPVGEFLPDQVDDPENIEGIVTGAYAVLDGFAASDAINSGCSNWQFGDVVSDDAYKGGGGTGDQNQIHLMEIFNANPTGADFEAKWAALYEGIKRCNNAIRILNASDYAEKEQRLAEMHFLRGHYYFNLKIIYNQIPWIDETVVNPNDYATISNVEFSSDELWGKIQNEFEQAYKTLPEDQELYGRPTKMAARAYMAKVYLYQSKWKECLEACDEVIQSGKYALLPDFRNVFLPENDNCSEIIFAVQLSINDGAANNENGSYGDRLLPPGGPYPTYGFLRPTQNLVNAYKTNEEGLPYNDGKDVSESDYVDVRLDHTLARPNIPFMDVAVYDWTPREASVYGPYSPKKRLVSLNSTYYSPIWPYVNALNFYVIRYADLLLWRAEAAIETGDLETGRKYINEIRERAKNTQHVRTWDKTKDAANYKVDVYSKPFTSKEEAINALRLERRLELAHEGIRFFDLVRWGIADQVINAYIEKEKAFRSHLQNAHFVKGKNEYFPIPQSIIDICGSSVMKQNPGY